MNAPHAPNLVTPAHDAGSELLALMTGLCLKEKSASAQMLCVPPAIKNRAPINLATLLPQNLASLQAANQRDLDCAFSAGLAGPLLDRLKLAKDLGTMTLGCSLD